MIGTIGLVYDLRNDYLAEGWKDTEVAEFDSEETIEAIADALGACCRQVDRIGHARALCARLVRSDRWDLVFSVAEGARGRSREAQVPALLELYGVPYVFSDPLTCAVTLDKAVAKRLVRSAGVNCAADVTVHSIEDLKDVSLRYPLFAKPLAEGTGKGIHAQSRIESPDALQRVCTDLLTAFRQPVLVEEYLPGREFTTGIVGTGLRARVLGTLEVRIRPGAPAQDYSLEVKEHCEEFVEYLPASGDPLAPGVEDLALRAYRSLECRDAGRVDVRLDAEGVPCFLELNPLPGLHPTHSDLPMIATAQEITYRELIRMVLASALDRIHGDDLHVR